MRVTVVSQPWAAPFTPGELASALRIRLQDAEVIVARSPPGDGSEKSVTVRSLDAGALRAERGSGDAVEFPLGGGVRGVADPAQVARRAALFIALFAEQGEPLRQVEPPDIAVTPPERPPGGRDVPPAIPAPTPASRAASPAPSVDDRWSLSAQIGAALAVDDDGVVSPAEALTVRGRRYLSPSTAVEIGAKLTGEYTTAFESQQVGVADHAFFAGIAHEAWLSPSVALDLGVAFQYTHPVIDIDGDGPVRSLSAPTITRFAVRTSAGVVWSPAEHVTVGLSISPSFSFREREYVDDAGREVLGVGPMIVDLTAGAGVRW
jgi:hypothetical protein